MKSLVEIVNRQVVVSSRDVARNFDKEHGKVIRSIEAIIEGIAKNGDTKKMFVKNEFINEQNGQQYIEYLMNRDGWTLLVMGFTGQKALEWKLKYIAAFNAMEKQLAGKHTKRPTKMQRQQLDNATKAERRRTAELWLKFGDMTSNQIHKEICTYYGTTELAGKEVLALPEAKEKTYSATEIGELLGVSANKIGRLARQNAMKTEKYGRWFYDKSAYSDKTVESFRYYEKAIDVFRKLVEAA